jgi:hypothetical protein
MNAPDHIIRRRANSLTVLSRLRVPGRIVVRLPEPGGARARAIVLLAGVCLASGAPVAQAAIITPSSTSGSSSATSTQSGTSEASGGSLESAAAKAGSTGRTVAMSLIGLAFAVAAIVLAFKRDFREAAGVFAVGIVCVLLATPTGVSVLKDTVSSLFGSH